MHDGAEVSNKSCCMFLTQEHGRLALDDVGLSRSLWDGVFHKIAHTIQVA